MLFVNILCAANTRCHGCSYRSIHRSCSFSSNLHASDYTAGILQGFLFTSNALKIIACRIEVKTRARNEFSDVSLRFRTVFFVFCLSNLFIRVSCYSFSINSFFLYLQLRRQSWNNVTLPQYQNQFFADSWLTHPTPRTDDLHSSHPNMSENGCI